MTAATFIAHVLALHLSVPEPVTFVAGGKMNGFEYVDVDSDKPLIAMIEREGPGWVLTYDADAWGKARPQVRAFVLAHELCHAAYDYERPWSSYTKGERRRKHARVRTCTVQILRAHARCKEGR
jgi:hypothetical protein